MIEERYSGRTVAALLGISEGALRKWRRHAAWSFGRPPYSSVQVRQMRRWAQQHLVQRPEAGPRGRTGGARGAAGEREAAAPAASAAVAEPVAAARPADGAAASGREPEELAALSDAELEGLLAEVCRDLREGAYGPQIKAGALLTIERIRNERQRRAIEGGKYLPVAEIERERLARIHAVKRSLLELGQLSRQIGQECGAGAAQEAAIRGLLEREARRILAEFAGSER